MRIIHVFLLVIFSILTIERGWAEEAKVRELSEKLKKELPDSTRLKVLGDLCWEYLFTDKDKALTYGIKELELTQKIKNKKAEGQAYHDIASVHFAWANYPEARKHFEKAYSIRKQIGDKRNSAASLIGLANIESHLGNYAPAISLSFEVLKIFEQLKEETSVCTVLGNIGAIYYASGKYDESLIYCEKGNELAVRNNMPRIIATNCMNIGNIYMNRMDYLKAEKYYIQALVNIEPLKDYAKIITILNGLGEVNSRLKKYDNSLNYFNRALSLSRESGDSRGEASCLISMGTSYLAIHNYKKAEENLIAGIELSKKLGIKNTLKNGLENLSALYQTTGNYKEALRSFQEFLVIKDSLINAESSAQIAEIETKYETEKKEKENQLLRQKNKINELSILSERKQKENQRIIFFGGSLVLLGIGGVVYRKRRSMQKEQLKGRVQKERISRDLHDNIGSQLSYIISNVNYSIGESPSLNNERLIAVEKEAKNTIQNLRDTIWAIHNETISGGDFASRLEKYILQQLEFNKKIELEFKNEAKNRILSPEEALNLFRISQEAVNNSIKYSEATKLKVEISTEQGSFIISLEDNGKGFDSSEIISENHYGLENIKNRAKSINAKYFIESQIGKGTLIKINLS